MHARAIVVCSLLLALPAHARDGEPSWSVGAGLFGWSGAAAPGAAQLGQLGQLVHVEARPGVLFEHRLGPGAWGLFALTGDYDHTNVSDQTAGAQGTDPQPQETETTRYGAAATVGMRQVLLGDGPVALSFFLTVTAALQRQDTTRTDAAPAGVARGRALKSETARHAVYGSVGLALERRLLDGLALRLWVDLASAGWSSAETQEARAGRADVLETRTNRFGAGLRLVPGLELRFLL